MRMITNIELTESGAARWNEWFAAYAAPGVRLHATTIEMMNSALDCASIGDTMTYELRGQFTNTGNPAVFCLRAEDVIITTSDDE